MKRDYLVTGSKKKIYYIVEPVEWVTNWEGKYITENIRRHYNYPIKMMKTSRIRTSLIRDQILHFGSRSTYLPDNYKYVNKKNKIVLTWYHGTNEDVGYIKALFIASRNISFVHTSNMITRNQLVKWGIEPGRIKIIPIGIDLALFSGSETEDKEKIREELGIPKGSVCIGSFQKDGNGWGAGNTPKRVKGPDILCDVLEKLKIDYPIFVLLTGPARGYVKNRLKESGIPFNHIFLKKYFDITRYYKALDFYIISSRTEGGPKSLLETFASGIPLVSTDVGMVHDIAKDGYNALISEIEDVNGLFKNSKRLIEDINLGNKLAKVGLETVKEFDWNIISKRYFEEIYSRLF